MHFSPINVCYEQNDWGVVKSDEDTHGIFEYTLTLTNYNETPERIKEIVAKVCDDAVDFDSSGACRVLKLVANWIILQKHVIDLGINRMLCIRAACEKDNDGPYLYCQWVDFDKCEGDHDLPDFYRELVEAVQDDRMKLYLTAAMCAEHRGARDPRKARKGGDIVGLKGLRWLYTNATFTRADDGLAEIGLVGMKHTPIKLTYDRKIAAMSGILPLQLYGHPNTLDVDIDNEIPF
tara:strand:+ start:6484 stop:7188 length:705 start_codon:yes stop_codon:yes gene_type:complete